MTSSSPHLAMFSYHRTFSAPAGAGGSPPAVVAVDPARAPVSHTISSAYEHYHARTAISPATFDPPPPPPALRGLPSGSMVLRPSYGAAHRALGLPTPAGMMRPQHPQRDEVIYQSVLRTPGSPQKLQQLQQHHAVNNGTCDIAAAAPDTDVEAKLHRPMTVDAHLHLANKGFDNKPTCVETVKSLTEAIRRLEANARDSAVFDDASSRSLQHSVSCGTIIVDPRTAGPDAAAAAANAGLVNARAGMDALGNVCRRSSYSPGGGGCMVRRAASMLVPVSAMEQAMQSGYQQDGGGDRLHHAPVTARPTSILDGMSRSCSVLPTYSDTLDDDGLLLPPSPFRSPDFDEEDSSCLDGVLASCGYGTPPPLPQPPPVDDRGGTAGQRATNGHRDRHLAILADLGRASDGGNFVWTSLPSPDDVTPTNENQPHGFGPNCRLVGPLPPPAPPPPPPPLGDKCPPVRYSDL